MPIGSRGSPTFIIKAGGPASLAGTYVPFRQPSKYTIADVTYDKDGVILGGCVVEIFTNEDPPRLVGATVSDPVTGAYSIDVPGPTADKIPSDGVVASIPLTFQAVAYLPGAPDRTGATVNTLVGTPS